MAVDKKIIPAPIKQATEWALFNACLAVLTLASGLAVDYVGCNQSSFLLRCVALTDAQAAEQSAFWFGWLCCAMLQAAAAVMSLRIPCRRSALAYLALVLTFVGHWMYAAGLRLLFVADPGFLFGWIAGQAIMVFFTGGDLVFFLGLLQLGGEDRPVD